MALYILGKNAGHITTSPSILTPDLHQLPQSSSYCCEPGKGILRGYQPMGLLRSAPVGGTEP